MGNSCNTEYWTIFPVNTTFSNTVLLFGLDFCILYLKQRTNSSNTELLFGLLYYLKQHDHYSGSTPTLAAWCCCALNKRFTMIILLVASNKQKFNFGKK